MHTVTYRKWTVTRGLKSHFFPLNCHLTRTGCSNNGYSSFPANLPFTTTKYVTGRRIKIYIIDREQKVHWFCCSINVQRESWYSEVTSATWRTEQYSIVIWWGGGGGGTFFIVCMLLKPQRFGTSFHFDHEVKRGQEPNLFHPLVQVSDYLDDGAQQVRFLSFHLMKEVETTSETRAHAYIHTYTADVRTYESIHAHT